MDTNVKDYTHLFADASLEDENKILKSTVDYLKNEISKFKQRPFLVCEARGIFNDKVLIRLANGNSFLVSVASELKEKISPGDLVLVEQRSLTIMDKLERSKKFDVENFVIVEKPSLGWEELGGLDQQVKELKEVMELPLKNPALFKKVGIQPPKGVLLHGPPGAGKTLLAKAVAASTNATFIEVVASELNQKFIGEGARLVKDIFSLAREKAPSIIFIDEMDAIASERLEVGTSGEREVQRTFMQLLAEIDGFKPLENVKVIGATNRLDILDPALLRPGRFDRLIEVPLPDEMARKEILKIHTRQMNVKGINFDLIARQTNEFTGADIKAVCTEAGYFAIRENRTKIYAEDFNKAIEKIRADYDEEHLGMFG